MFININTVKGQNAEAEGRKALNPANSLIRYQLMELLIRVAMVKYPVMPTEAQAFEKVCEDHLRPKLGNLDQTVWRREHTLNEYVDNVMKAFRPVFKHLFREYGGKKQMPGQRNYIAMEEFELLCQETGILADGLCTTAQVRLCYNLAMFTQVDELYSTRHQAASFTEFLEAIARVLDKAALAPLHQIEGQELTDDERVEQTLFEKIENAIPYLLSCCQQKWLETTYVNPQKNIEENLYLLVNGKFF